jgi:hypothetical protein
MARLLGAPNHNLGDYTRSRLGGLEIVTQILSQLPGAQDIFKRAIVESAARAPQSARTVVMLIAFYLHFGPFSRHVVRQIERRLENDQDVAHFHRPWRQPNVSIPT